MNHLMAESSLTHYRAGSTWRANPPPKKTADVELLEQHMLPSNTVVCRDVANAKPHSACIWTAWLRSKRGRVLDCWRGFASHCIPCLFTCYATQRSNALELGFVNETVWTVQKWQQPHFYIVFSPHHLGAAWHHPLPGWPAKDFQKANELKCHETENITLDF